MSTSRWTYLSVTILFVQLLSGANAQRAIQKPGDQPYTNGLPGTVNLTYAISGADDKSPMSVAVDSSKAVRDLVNPKKGSKDILLNLDAYREALKQLPTGVFYFGSQARAGSHNTLFTQDFLYSDGPSGVDISEQAIVAHETGVAFGVKRELTGDRQKYAVAAFKARESLPSTSMRVVPSPRSVPNLRKPLNFYVMQASVSVLEKIRKFPVPPGLPDDEHIKSFDKLRKQFRDALGLSEPDAIKLAMRIDTAIEYFNKMQYDARISSFLGYRAFPSADLWTVGLSLSQLLTEHNVCSNPQREVSGVFGIVNMQGAFGHFEDRNVSHRLSALRTGFAVYWQDKIPYINPELVTKDAFVSRWRVQAGLEFRLASGVDREVSYSGFFRYRELKSDYETTISAGKDASNQAYVNLSVGRSFRIF